MSYAEALIVIIASAALSAALAATAGRLVHVDLRRRHHDVGSIVFLQLGVVFAVLLAFVFSKVWSEYNTAADAISGECASLHGVAILAATLPPPQSQQILRADLVYLEDVVQVEWPMMAERRESDQAHRDFVALWELIARTDSTKVRDAMLGQITTAHEHREMRLFQMVFGVPKAVWAFLILFATVLTGFVIFAGVEFLLPHVGFSAVFTATIVSVLVLVKLLDYPFEGGIRLSTDDFRHTIARVNILANGGG